METIVGIDLGTTNSEVAFIINDKAEVLKDNDNGIVPSCVGLDKAGKVIVGIEARNQAIIEPERTALSIKRRMGSSEKVMLGDTAYLPQEISAFILKALKTRAEKVLNCPISKAIITVPAYFTDAQRQATREAGEIAGLNVVRIINEPTAAALCYESTFPEARKILIFDLGGGTFDVSIVKIEKGVVEVLSSTGDNHLGGDDFDQKIMNRLESFCEKELNITVANNPTLLARIKRAAENAKIALSSAPFTNIEEDHIGKRGNTDVHLSYELSRIEFESMIEDDLMRTMESVSRAMEDASLLPSDIDKIILVGGSTRIPKISEMLEEKFGQPPHGEIDPDLCVALGAAIHAGREMGIDATSILLDITPYTFGTSALGEIDGEPSINKFVPIIRRNTKLPAQKSEAFYTLADNQEAVEIKVYQGENPNALDNILIGNYTFKLTRGAPRNSTIILNYDLDLNGILKMRAIEKVSGRQISAVIENAFSGFTEQEMSDSKKKIHDIWTDVETYNPQPTIPTDISALLMRAESMLNSASAEDRDEIINLIEDIRYAASSNRLEDARNYSKKLEDILFYIE